MIALATTPRTPRGLIAASRDGQVARRRMTVERGRRKGDDDLGDRGAASGLEHAEHRRERPPQHRRRRVVPRQQGQVVDLPRPTKGDQTGQLVGAGVDGVDAQCARRAGRCSRLDDAAGRGPGIGQVGERPSGQVVDDIDRLTLDDQPVDEVGADEPGPADDENGPFGLVGGGRDDGAVIDVGESSALTPIASPDRFGNSGVDDGFTVGDDRTRADHGSDKPGPITNRTHHD